MFSRDFQLSVKAAIQNYSSISPPVSKTVANKTGNYVVISVSSNTINSNKTEDGVNNFISSTLAPETPVSTSWAQDGIDPSAVQPRAYGSENQAVTVPT